MKIKYIIGALAAAFTIGTANAGDVEVYGLVDVGVGYNHTSVGTGGSEDDFDMTSGVHSGSRIGLRGAENLTETTKIGFQLEQGFNVDSGEFSDDDRAFSREARLYIANNTWGEVSVGRMGAIDSGNGTYGIMANVSPFETGWSSIGSSERVLYGMSRGRYDNMITYKSPDLSGARVYFQYSTDTDQSLDGDEGSSHVNRYGAAGVTGTAGPVDFGVTFAITDYANTRFSDHGDDTGFAGTLFAKYNYNDIVPSIAVQWFDSAQQSRFDSNGNPIQLIRETAGLDGVGVVGAVSFPLYGGTTKMSISYRNAEYSEPYLANGDDNSWNLVQTAIGYEYSFSKRTSVYGGIGYTWEEEHGNWKDDQSNVEVATGLICKF